MAVILVTGQELQTIPPPGNIEFAVFHKFLCCFIGEAL